MVYLHVLTLLGAGRPWRVWCQGYSRGDHGGFGSGVPRVFEEQIRQGAPRVLPLHPQQLLHVLRHKTQRQHKTTVLT